MPIMWIKTTLSEMYWSLLVKFFLTSFSFFCGYFYFATIICISACHLLMFHQRVSKNIPHQLWHLYVFNPVQHLFIAKRLHYTQWRSYHWIVSIKVNQWCLIKKKTCLCYVWSMRTHTRTHTHTHTAQTQTHTCSTPRHSYLY